MSSASQIGLVAALVIPWILGSAVLRLLFYQTSRANLFILLGHGYFVGIFVTTLVIRAWDGAGIALSFWPIVSTLAALSSLALLARPSRQAGPEVAELPSTMHAWEKIVIAIFVTLIAWRYLMIFQEIMLRPMYSWDTWMNWAPKAKVWLHHSALVEFVTPTEWLSRDGDTSSYTLGNSQASTYPPTVPLITLWQMMALGTDDHPLVFLPWWFLCVGLGLAFYGHLRKAGASRLTATTACYILLSIPYLNVHTILPGYADLWQTAAFTLAFLCLSAAGRASDREYWVLCIFYTLICSQVKNPGIVLSMILVVVLLRKLLNPKPARELAVLGTLIGLSIVVFTWGFNIELPLIGSLSVSSTEISSSIFGTFELKYHPVAGAFKESLFLMINWNLLWYACIALTAARIFTGKAFQTVSNETLTIYLVFLFLLFVFFFTRHHQSASNFATLNRAILYVIPAMIYYFFIRWPLKPAAISPRNDCN